MSGEGLWSAGELAMVDQIMAEINTHLDGLIEAVRDHIAVEGDDIALANLGNSVMLSQDLSLRTLVIAAIWRLAKQPPDV